MKDSDTELNSGSSCHASSDCHKLLAPAAAAAPDAASAGTKSTQNYVDGFTRDALKKRGPVFIFPGPPCSVGWLPMLHVLA